MIEYRAIDGQERGLAKDPALLNRIAWDCRWQSRQQSCDYSQRVRTLLDGEQTAEARVQYGLSNATLAWQAKWRGDFDDAMQFALNAESTLSETAFPEKRAELYSILGVLYYSRHRLDLADGAVKRGLGLMAPAYHHNTYAELLTICADVHRHGGDLRSAGEVLGRARKIATGETLARVESNIARWMLSEDAPAHALAHANIAIDLSVAHRNNVILPYAHELAGAALVQLGEHERAETHFTTALDLATADHDTRVQCQILGWYAGLERKRAAPERARDLYRYGREIAQKMNYMIWETTFSRRLAEVYEELGDLENAVECHRRAWELTDEKRQ